MLANVLAILFIVVGAVVLFRLPVPQYPDVVPPTVQVTTRYPGASARTVVGAGRAAHRATGQRRRWHDLHAIP
jgi:multidrug efflux pump subunit AcrB